MLTAELARNLLHTVNIQISSNVILIDKNSKSTSLFSFSQKWEKYTRTQKTLKQLSTSYPKEHIENHQNLLSQLAVLYSQFRNAYKQLDIPQLHRLTTNDLYQQLKSQQKQQKSVQIFQKVGDIKVQQGHIVQNQHGKWAQLGVRYRFVSQKGTVQKQYIVERKLGMGANYTRKWYYVDL